MSFGRKRKIFGASALAAIGFATLPLTTGFAFETEEAITAEADDMLLLNAGMGDLAMAASTEPVIELNDSVTLLADEETETPIVVEEAEAEALAINDARDEELECLAKAIQYESRGEPHVGQLAVAQVIMNRVASPRFPNSICGVIYQRGQFSSIHRYTPRRGAMWERSIALAIDARNSVSGQVAPGALYFHTTRVSPRFARTKQRVAQHGNHIFYR